MDNIIVTYKTLIQVLEATYDVAKQLSLDKPPKVDRVGNIWDISKTIGSATIYAYSSETFWCCPIKITWNRNTDEIFIGVYSSDNKLITINRNGIQFDTKKLERAGFMVSSAFQKLYNRLKYGLFANIYRKIYSKEEMKMNNNEEKKESKTISKFELYDIMYEYIKPTIKKYVEEGGNFSACSNADAFRWNCRGVSWTTYAYIGARFENGCWKIWTISRDNVNIIIDGTCVGFDPASTKFDHFSEEFMRGLYNKLNDYIFNHYFKRYCDQIEKAVSDPNGWESVNMEYLNPTYRYNQYGKLEPVIDPFMCAKINTIKNDIEDIISKTENEKRNRNHQSSSDKESILQ